MKIVWITSLREKRNFLFLFVFFTKIFFFSRFSFSASTGTYWRVVLLELRQFNENSRVAVFFPPFLSAFSFCVQFLDFDCKYYIKTENRHDLIHIHFNSSILQSFFIIHSLLLFETQRTFFPLMKFSFYFFFCLCEKLKEFFRKYICIETRVFYDN